MILDVKDRIIIYEKLNLATFCLSVIGRPFFKKAYFYAFSPYIKKYFFPVVKNMGHEQITHLNFLEAAVEPRASVEAIRRGNKIVDDNPLLANVLVGFMDDVRAEDLTKQVALRDLAEDAHKYIVLKEFIATSGKRKVYYFPAAKNFIIDAIGSAKQKVIIVRWHLPLLSLVKLAQKTICFMALLTAPILLLLRQMLARKIALKRSTAKVLSKDLVFFHQVHGEHPEDSNIYRLMYLFKSGILKISDCIHICLQRAFSLDKARYLEKNGGAALSYQTQKMPLSYFMKRLFADYYRYVMPAIFVLSFGEFGSISSTKDIVLIMSTTVKFEDLLKKIDVRLAFLETEMGYSLSIFTIAANKRGIKTMTMMHGIGGYCFPNYSRSNIVANYYLVPGRYYEKYMRPYNPHVDIFYPTGNHEIEELSGQGTPNLQRFKREGVKIVGVLANFYWPFFPASQSAPYSWPLFDEQVARSAFLHYWQPFFRWAGRQEKLFFIFKGKAGYGQYEHPFLKEVMTELPKERYHQDDNILMREIIAASDYAVCSANSSALYSSLCHGIPAVSYALSQTGYVAAGEHSKYIVPHTPEDIQTNLEHILVHGLPAEVFEGILRDHHLAGDTGKKTSLFIQELIDKTIKEAAHGN